MHSVLEILEEPTGSSSDLISLSDLKFALGITGTSEDVALQAAISFQSRIITEYCDRRFAFASQALETFTFDWNEWQQPRNALTLGLYPTVDVFEVSTLGATTSDFEFDPPSGRLWTRNLWGFWGSTPEHPWGPFGGGKIAVTYSGGYNLPDEAPARLQQAVIEAVNIGRTTSSRDAGIREVQHGDTRIAYFTPALATQSSGFFSAGIVDLIKPFRKIYVA